ncbi:hypothetical protein H7J07_18235 [Mycobacterium koreense]|uniref:Uncharacterized protein n=1 Tax=Mycolicibacillus koreensis TaxID=1069220 RepID=A0A7I7SHW4_9MYCO|nr:hypothetical protein [Mycolicibacillus koreensis]MCV7250136.1 hypothetical protein [Mycolicibacillus koreensis]OSC31828.1 hypothetical protein B8W67_15935 [Mycolicibacillus koreensis]BBY56130.1 hypothetical protein MKOR_33810 [Mycolicibacillus koreensis]
MGRVPAVISHVVCALIAAALYFFFVLPRWWELTGGIPLTAGTVLRVITGLVIAAAAIPVALNLARVRGPEHGLPQAALSLRIGAIAAHLLAGVLIIATAISEIWLSLDDVGQWLFGVYGGAAAVAVLGMAAFYLAFVAEQPAPPEKPLTPKTRRTWFGKKTPAPTAVAGAAAESTASTGTELDESDETDKTEAADGAEDTEEAEAADKDTGEDDTGAAGDDTAAEPTESGTDDTDTAEATEATTVTDDESDTPGSDEKAPDATATEPDTATATATDSEVKPDSEATAAGGLRNRRPTGKSARQRRRTRGGRTGAD